MIFVELPYGWEEFKDPNLGTVIYVDHNTGKIAALCYNAQKSGFSWLKLRMLT